MTLVTGIDDLLSVDAFLEEQGQALRRPEARESAHRAVDEAARLMQPAIVYEWLPATMSGPGRVRVGETVLNVGGHARLMKSAHEAFVGIVTAGPRLEERARELGASGRALDGFVLGEVGTCAVGRLIKMTHGIAEAEAAARGWGVGAELAPGQLAGWGIGEQRLLCGLLDIGSIGVRVTETGMLEPQKSASVMIGIGPDYDSQEVLAPCGFCDQQEVCRYRH